MCTATLRAYLRGWKFIFLDHVTCMNEIPAVGAVEQLLNPIDPEA
jgi:hypothetical protein